MDITLIRTELLFMLGIGVVVFYQLSHASNEMLLAMLVFAGIAWVGYQYLTKKYETIEKTQKNIEVFMDKEAEQRREVHTDQPIVATFPKKGLRFLRQNGALMNVAKKVVICRMFDRGRYSELLMYLDKLQKTYMYILDKRYPCKDYVTIFIDLQEGVLQNLYSMYFVVPTQLKHIYGMQPHKEIAGAIDDFTSVSQEMLEVLRNFSMRTAKLSYFPEMLPKPADGAFDPLKTRILP